MLANSPHNKTIRNNTKGLTMDNTIKHSTACVMTKPTLQATLRELRKHGAFKVEKKQHAYKVYCGKHLVLVALNGRSSYMVRYNQQALQINAK